MLGQIRRTAYIDNGQPVRGSRRLYPYVRYAIAGELRKGPRGFLMVKREFENEVETD